MTNKRNGIVEITDWNMWPRWKFMHPQVANDRMLIREYKEHKM